MELTGLREKWQVCQAQDAQKEAVVKVRHLLADTSSVLFAHLLFKALFNHIEELSHNLSEVELELRDKKDVNLVIRARVEDAEKQIHNLRLERVPQTEFLAILSTKTDCSRPSTDLPPF